MHCNVIFTLATHASSSGCVRRTLYTDLTITSKWIRCILWKQKPSHIMILLLTVLLCISLKYAMDAFFMLLCCVIHSIRSYPCAALFFFTLEFNLVNWKCKKPTARDDPVFSRFNIWTLQHTLPSLMDFCFILIPNCVWTATLSFERVRLCIVLSRWPVLHSCLSLFRWSGHTMFTESS